MMKRCEHPTKIMPGLNCLTLKATAKTGSEKVVAFQYGNLRAVPFRMENHFYHIG